MLSEKAFGDFCEKPFSDNALVDVSSRLWRSSAARLAHLSQRDDLRQRLDDLTDREARRHAVRG